MQPTVQNARSIIRQSASNQRRIAAQAAHCTFTDRDDSPSGALHFPTGGDRWRRRCTVEWTARQSETAGLTQRELAARMGTSQAAVARLEAGGTGATMTTLQKVASAHGLKATVALSAAS